MMIDANAHITEDGRWFETNLDASVTRLIQEMKSAAVEKAVLVPFDGNIRNEFILETVRKHKRRFIPACSINPARFSDKNKLVHAFKKIVANQEFRILKLHNRLHRYQLHDARVFWLLKANESLKKPLVIYICGYINSCDVIHQMVPPQVFQTLAASFKKTKFVIMHAGGTWALSLYEAIREYENVYLDLSHAVSKFKDSSLTLDYNYLIKHFDERLVWGSDFPEYSLVQARRDFAQTAGRCPKNKIDNIVHRNILKIIKI